MVCSTDGSAQHVAWPNWKFCATWVLPITDSAGYSPCVCGQHVALLKTNDCPTFCPIWYFSTFPTWSLSVLYHEGNSKCSCLMHPTDDNQVGQGIQWLLKVERTSGMLKYQQHWNCSKVHVWICWWHQWNSFRQLQTSIHWRFLCTENNENTVDMVGLNTLK